MNKPLIVLNMRYQKLCDLNDNSKYRPRDLKETFTTGEVNELTFSYPINSPKWECLSNENLILFNGEYYRIKTPVLSDSSDAGTLATITCRHLSETLQTTIVSLDEITPKTATELMKIALCYENDKPTLGWSVGKVDVDQTIKRGLESSEQSSFENILGIAEKFDAFPIFHSSTLTVDLLANTANEDTPSLNLEEGRQLKSISVTYDTSEMITRLYCFGGDDDNGNELTIMNVNPTKLPYIENFQYFYDLGYTDDDIKAHPELFIKTNVWRDSNYYDEQDLYNDGLLELSKVAKPKVTVTISALDMSKYNRFQSLDLNIGDCVKVSDSRLNISTVCNVTSRTIDYENEHILTLTLSDNIEYKSVLSKLFSNSSTVDKITTGGGSIKDSAIPPIKVDQIEDFDSVYGTLKDDVIGSIDTGSIKLSSTGETMFTEKDNKVTPESITIVATCKNGITVDRWLIDGTVNTSFVAKDKLSITIPASYMTDKNSILVRAENSNGNTFDTFSISKIKNEISTLLRIESSRGTVFKNNAVSTVLSVVIYHGSKRIIDSETMKDTFGAGAYLQWTWQRLDDDSYGVISSGDSHLSNNGFSFSLTPEDVDVKVTFKCELII